MRQMAMPPPSSEKPGSPAVPLNLRLPTILAAAIGALAIIGSIAAGSLAFGAFFVLGLFLGLGNMWLVRRDVIRVTSAADPSKQSMALSSAARLVVITAIALVIGFLLKPVGLGVFFGLAVSQILLLTTTTVPVLKGLRQQS